MLDDTDLTPYPDSELPALSSPADFALPLADTLSTPAAFTELRSDEDERIGTSSLTIEDMAWDILRPCPCETEEERRSGTVVDVEADDETMEGITPDSESDPGVGGRGKALDGKFDVNESGGL